MVTTTSYDPAELYFTVVACGVGFIWLVIGIIMAFRSFTNGTKNPRAVLKWLIVGMILTGIVSLALTYKVITPLLVASTLPKSDVKAKLPDFDYAPFHSWAVQHAGREKPFESAAAQIVREITGRSKFEGE